MAENHNNVALREAEQADTEVICRLWLALMQEHELLDQRFVLSEDAGIRWKNDLPMWLEDGTRKIVLAENAGNVVGFIQAHRRVEPPIFKEIPEVYIDEVYVVPSQRGHGVGRLLLDEIKDWAERGGAEIIRLRVLAENEAGKLFWERSGAQQMDVTYTLTLENKTENAKKKSFRKLGF